MLLNKADVKNGGTDDGYIRNLIMTLGVTYYVRLEPESRPKFAKEISDIIEPVEPEFFAKVISKCQDLFLEKLKLECNIAKNDALKV